MKKICLVLIAILTFSPGVYSARYHVDNNNPDASDTNTGNEANPFLTIQKAAEAAKSGDTVFVHKGIYRETIVPAQSGTSEAPIVFMPWKNQKVVISGTELIDEWAQHEGNIYKAPMPGDFFESRVNQTDQVFVDGKMMNLARWPNTGLEPSYPVKAETNKFVSKEKTGNITTGVMIDDDLPEGDYIGAEIYMQPNNGAWSWTFTGKVTDVNGTQFSFESFSSSGQDFQQDVYHPNSRYYFYNKESLLDTTGEWYHDKENALLYLWLPDNAEPNNHVIEAKKRDYGFDLSKKSYIEIHGFHFFACNVTTDNASGGDGKGYTEDGTVRYPWRGVNSVAESHHITLDGIHCLYPSHSTEVSGHFFFQYGGHSGIVLSGHNHILQNSSIRYSFANGISLLGYNHKIHNNLIEDVNYSACGYGALGSSASKAYDCKVSYNTIRRTGRSGIRLGIINSDPSNIVARLHHNEISDFMLQDNDGGGIYMGGNGNFLRIDHNIIHDGRGYIVSGIYPDWGKNYIFDHNIIYNMWANFQFTHSYDQEGINNFVVYNNTAICTNNDGFSYGPFNFVCSGDKEGVILKNNIGWVYTPPNASSYKPWSDNNTFDLITKSNNLFEVDPQLVNYPENFQLTPSSPAVDAGEPMDTVVLEGVKIPPFNDTTIDKMDIGAYEYSMEPFMAGSSLDTLKGSVIEIFAAGESNEESITLMINDNPVAIFNNIGGNSLEDNFIKYTFIANGIVFPEMVKIWYNNFNEVNTKIRIDRIAIDEIEYQAEDVINSCNAENTEYLDCNGFFHFRLKNKYNISVEAENGTVELNPPGGIYNEGSQVTITAIPDEGYAFESWSGDASGTSNPKTLSVNRNRNITANFIPVSAINNSHDEWAIKVYPNPANKRINLEFGLSWKDEVTITVHDIHGNMVFQDRTSTRNGKASLNLSDFALAQPGIYSIRISDTLQIRTYKLAIR